MTALEEIVAEFARNVAAQNEAIERGDAQTGNKHARLYIKAFDKLRAEGDVGREALVRLFEHERPDVRAMAAVFLLRYRAEEAKPVLDAVARTQKG
jgi:hypothetical protein